MLRNTFKTITRTNFGRVFEYTGCKNMSSWRKHILEKEKRKMETENINKIVNKIDDLKNEIFCLSMVMAWSSVGIMFCIRNK